MKSSVDVCQGGSRDMCAKTRLEWGAVILKTSDHLHPALGRRFLHSKPAIKVGK